MAYFLLTSGNDRTQIKQLTEESLLKRIQEYLDAGYAPEFLTQIPGDDGAGRWCAVSKDAMLIIKGEIVVPTPVHALTYYKL